MGEEATFLAKYAPYYIPILAAIVLIIFTKNYLFKGTISTELYREQVTREGELVKGTETVSNRLEEIVKQLESLTRKVSEEIRENTDRLQAVETIQIDTVSVLKDLAFTCEKHRKNIPDTVEFREARKK
jgi:hypothetical protein